MSPTVDQVGTWQGHGVAAAILSGDKGVDQKLLACEKDILVIT